jgi:hypothetical protein
LAAAQKFLLISSRALARGVLLTPEFVFSMSPDIGLSRGSFILAAAFD